MVGRPRLGPVSTTYRFLHFSLCLHYPEMRILWSFIVRHRQEGILKAVKGFLVSALLTVTEMLLMCWEAVFAWLGLAVRADLWEGSWMGPCAKF